MGKINTQLKWRIIKKDIISYNLVKKLSFLAFFYSDISLKLKEVPNSIITLWAGWLVA